MPELAGRRDLTATGAGYTLQLIPQTTLYDAQRATGAVQVANAEITLPLGSPAAAPKEQSGAGGRASQGAEGKSTKTCKTAKRKARAKGKHKAKKRCKKGKRKKR